MSDFAPSDFDPPRQAFTLPHATLDIQSTEYRS
jgi:hypothetical protein